MVAAPLDLGEGDQQRLRRHTAQEGFRDKIKRGYQVKTTQEKGIKQGVPGLVRWMEPRHVWCWKECGGKPCISLTARVETRELGNLASRNSRRVQKLKSIAFQIGAPQNVQSASKKKGSNILPDTPRCKESPQDDHNLRGEVGRSTNAPNRR